MKIVIKNDTTSFMLSVKHTDYVANVKSLYQSSGKCTTNVQSTNDNSGQRFSQSCNRQQQQTMLQSSQKTTTTTTMSGYIVLLFKGKELDDEKTLGESGIAEGSVLIHIAAYHDPFRGINYAQLAEKIATRKHHEEENLRMLQQENIWAPDALGTVRSLGFDKSLISTQSPRSNNSGNRGNHRNGHRNSGMPNGGMGMSNGGRSFFNQLSVCVNGSNFHVLPKMEGRWNGEMATVPVQEEGTQVVSNELLFREDEGVWSQRQTSTTILGMATTNHYWLKPAADGILKAETDDASLRDCDITYKEEGTNIVLVTATSKRTGMTILVETMTLVDSGRRLRTVQRFDESGAIRYVLVMNEKRVVDAVSGAMERYDGLSSPRF